MTENPIQEGYPRMTLKPRFDNVFNWTHLITIVSMIAGGMLLLTEMRSEVDQMRVMILELRDQGQDREVRIRALELGFGRIEERLVAIQSNLQQLVLVGDGK